MANICIFCWWRTYASDRNLNTSRVACLQLTLVFNNGTRGAPTAAGIVLYLTDMMLFMSQPFSKALPEVMLQLILSDPTGSAAVSYRRYVREVVVPMLRQILELLRLYSAAIEW